MNNLGKGLLAALEAALIAEIPVIISDLIDLLHKHKDAVAGTDVAPVNPAPVAPTLAAE